MVGSGNINDATTDGEKTVSVTMGNNKEPRPVTVEAEIIGTGKTCSYTINDGDGQGPFELCK